MSGPEPSKKQTKVGSPNSKQTDTLSDEMVIGFPPTANKMAYVEDDCLEYVHDGGPLDIGCDFTAVDDLVLSNLICSAFQYTDYFSLIHDFKEFFSDPPFKDAPAAPWDFDIFKRKIICVTAKNKAHYGVFAALNAGILIHGDKSNK